MKLRFPILLVLLAVPALAFAEPLPESLSDQGSLLYRLYKAGHLIPAVIVAAFFVLTLLQKHVSWLRVGYRKVAVSAALAGLAMLAERAASGTTPNLTMVMGALGAALTMWMQTQGEPKAEPTGN